MPLQTHIRNAIAFDRAFASDGRRAAASASASCSAVQTLVRHLLVAMPKVMLELVPNITAGLDSDTAGEAVMAAEFLSLLLVTPLPGDDSVAATALQQLLRAAASPLAELRVKVAHVLPVAARCGAVHGVQRLCRRALQARLLDAEASVRAAAVRGLGSLLGGCNSFLPDENELEALIERLKDSVPEVRLAVRAALLHVRLLSSPA
jgi:HEAT repeat associated with sister chromatid cohesion